jgi:transglutaminase-like putative cysteine protease
VIDGLVDAIASGSVDTGSIDLVDQAQVPWERVTRCLYLIDQELRYRYEGPIRDLRHRLVVVPRHVHGDQRRVDYRVSVGSPPARAMTARRDRHGNAVVDVAVERIEEEISFRAVIAVTRSAESRSPRLSASQVALYRAPTALTAPDPRLEETAGQLRRLSPDGLPLAHAINEWVHAAMRYEYGVTHVGTTAAEALAAGRGVCQDHAHIMLALCRLCGLPARYVSGHLLGEGGSHAWVEVLLPDGPGAAFAAHAFDPTHGCATGPGHLTVAVGRDYTDVPPTSGSYRSGFAGSLTTRKRAGIVALEYAA